MDELHKRTPLLIFEDIDHEDVELLCAQGREQKREEGQPLFERGEEASELMILKEGAVELCFPIHVLGVTRYVSIETKETGEVVAWSALVEPHRYTLSARCVRDCVITCFHRETLAEFFSEHPAIGYLFMQNMTVVIGRRLQSMHNIWLHDLMESAIKRLE